MVVATHHSRELAMGRDAEHEVTDHGAADEDDGSQVLDAGVYVDRYRILDVVGSGGIGVVYAAFDEALGRNVALKLLRPSARSSARLERRRARLIREAQALARLSHPNVVPIYEVGMFDDRVFLAMEYIEGATMRRWLRTAARSVDEILDKYIQAGRGLAAAHAADIVHRDFKPDNVLVGEDGRVRVLDFGLATPVPDALATGRYATLSNIEIVDEGAGTRDASKHLGKPLGKAHDQTRLTESVAALVTAHGKIMGTPAYMAPEQARGEAIDARADQYSFCVSVWEALFGERPHGPPTATARIRITRRLAEHGHDGKAVPPKIQRALERGLSLDPAERFPDMPTLLDALTPEPKGRRRWVLVSATVAVAMLAVGAAMLGPRAEVEQCPREPEQLAGIWDTHAREQIATRVATGGQAHASATWDAIADELDRWTARWLDARVDTCTQARERNEHAQLMFDLRMDCLDRQLDSLRAVTDRLGGDQLAADDHAVRLEHALAATLALPDPQRCEGVALVGGAMLDDEADDVPEHQREQLARARAALDMGMLDEALTLADELVGAQLSEPVPSSATQTAHSGARARASLLAEAKLLRGRIFAAKRDGEAAQHELRRGLLLAQELGQDMLVVEACAALVDLLLAEAELDRAQDWAELGRATLKRIGGDAQLEAELRMTTARLASARGQSRLALDDLRRALELREQLYGPEHVEVARVLLARSEMSQQLGAWADADADLERAQNIMIAQFGFTHPEVGAVLVREAALARARGDHAAALTKLLDALAMFELAYDGAHRQLLDTQLALADLQIVLEHPGEARQAIAKARANAEALGVEIETELAELELRATTTPASESDERADQAPQRPRK